MDDQQRSKQRAAGLLVPPGDPAVTSRSAALERGCRTKGWSVRRVEDSSGMPQNFLECDREQVFLMPPSLRDWLPVDHFAWFVIETVARMDLGAFYEAYRADGHGRAAHEPAMMVSLLTYAYSTGVYSSRGIERHCR